MNESRVSVGRLKARLSHYLRRAEAGEPIVVTDRGRPVARLVGLEGETALESRLDELVLTGLVRRPNGSLPDDFLRRSRPSDPEGRSLDAILEERGEGR